MKVSLHTEEMREDGYRYGTGAFLGGPSPQEFRLWEQEERTLGRFPGKCLLNKPTTDTPIYSGVVGGQPGLAWEAAQSCPTHLQVRGEVRGRAGRECSLLLSCTVSCLQINGIIQFPGLLTFSLGINCDHPNKYRQITLKTYIYEAHLLKTFSNSEKYLGPTKRKHTHTHTHTHAHTHTRARAHKLNSEPHTYPFLSLSAAGRGVLILDGPDDLMVPPQPGQRLKKPFFVHSKSAKRR